MRQQRVGRDVERHAEEDVGRALVELAGEPAVRDVELEQAVARRQRHLATSAGFQAVTISRRESGLRRIFVDHVGDLVDGRAVRAPARSATAGRRPGRARRPRRPTRPRCATPWSFRYSMLVSPARNHSSSWMIDFRCSFLVVTSGKPSRQIETHLVAEDGARAGAGAVALLDAVVQHVVAAGRGTGAWTALSPQTMWEM